MNSHPACLFDAIPCASRILAKLLRRQAVNGAVPIAMTSGLMSQRNNLADEVGALVREPADDEKRRLNVVLIEKV